jgi:organic hydroperoxide reductase OsmC/OhrA
LEWDSLEAHVEGTLERIDGMTRFTRYLTRAVLTVNPTVDHSKAKELLERAEKVCLVANSLRGERMLEATVNTVATTP